MKLKELRKLLTDGVLISLYDEKIENDNKYIFSNKPILDVEHLLLQKYRTKDVKVITTFITNEFEEPRPVLFIGI